MIRHGLLVLTAALFIGAAARDSVDDWIDRTALPLLQPETGTEVRDRNGQLLRAYTVEDGRWRFALSPSQVDQGYIDMLIAYEDRRFFRHRGVDPRALARAAGQALWHGRIVSGGSTLSMQTARLLENSGTGHWPGKLRQMRLALALERRLDKAEILGLYLTLAPFGGNLEGIRAATLAYFGKEPRRLTPAESALLVALPQAPETRRPDLSPGRAEAARARVLDRAVARGVVDADTAHAAQRDPVPAERLAFPMTAPHLADRARAAHPGLARHDLTLDAPLQSALERLARHSLPGIDPRASIAMVVADHVTGEILASVGSARFAADRRDGFVDMTRALRSPGSTLKPLVYALAFDRGLAHPETLIADRPVAFGPYAPQNFDGQFRGDVRVTEALQLSLNIPVVLLLQELGPARLMAALRQAGTEPVLPGGRAGLAIGLGGLGLTVEDLATLYAGLAQGGIARPLRWHAAQPDPPERQRFAARSAAWQTGHILSGLAPPPGAPANRLAYKTGTSYGHRDVWAVGFDGRHVAVVWMGRPDGTPLPGAFGGALAAPVLFEIFQRVKPALDPLPPPPPETLMLSAAALPQPLQRFRGRDAAFGTTAADAPDLAFPPDGARLLAGGEIAVKIRRGAPPFTLLRDGAVAVTGARNREIPLPVSGQGFVDIAVIDARGRSDSVRVRLAP